MPTKKNAPEAPSETPPPSTDKQQRGFAVMDRTKVQAIASRGGRSAHAHGNAHEFTAGTRLPREAGRKGGLAKGRRMAAERAAAADAAPQASTETS